MLSSIPTCAKDQDDASIDRQLIRAGLISELDAISLYEQMAATAKDAKLKKILLDIASEERRHIGELSSLLLELDPDQAEQTDRGQEEVEEKA